MTQQLVFVLNHFWQSTLVAALAWLLCRTILQNNSPGVRYAVWLTASFKFLVPLSLLIQFGNRMAPRPLITLTQSQKVFELASVKTGALATAPFLAASARQAKSDWLAILSTVLMVVWAVGGAVVVGNWLRSWWRIRRAARRAVRTGDFQGIPIFASAMMRSERIEPGVFGIVNPVILLPEGMEQSLNAQEMRAVLHHEWSHIRRHDDLTAALQMLSEAAFWFYPLIWLVGARLMDERELACDQSVLDHAQKEDYAEAIVKVCKLYVGSPLDCMAGIMGADLRTRVQTILQNRRPDAMSKSKQWMLATALALVVVGPTVIGFLTAPAVYAQVANSFVGMATAVEKKFEVATVKLSAPGQQGGRLGPPGRGSISIVNLPLRNIIIQSFRSQRSMVFGGPEWINSERYDIVGKGPDPNLTNPEIWEMMRSLLIERFHLKYHVEERELPVFALVQAPGGHKLKLGENGRCAAEVKEGKNCGDITVRPFGVGMYNMPIGALVTSLAGKVPRPLIDKTGLMGKYDANITWLPEGVKMEDLAETLAQMPAEYRPQDMNMFEALEKQGGFKLEPQKAPMKVLVIDSVERPTDN